MKNYGKFLIGTLILGAMTAGAVESVPGVRGRAVRIKGAEEYLVDPENKKFDFKAGISVSFWVKGNSWSQQAGIISGLGDTVISKRYASPYGSFYFNTRIGGHNAALLWAPKCFHAPLNKWVNIGLSYDTKTKITTGYFNGKKCAEWDVGKAYPTRSSYRLRDVVTRGRPFCLGRSSGINFDGTLDEIFIYNRPLNEQEMARVSAGEMLPGLQAAYLFDDPADIGKDSSPAKRRLVKVPGNPVIKLPKIGFKVKSPVLFADKNLTVWTRSAVEKTFKYDRVIPAGTDTAPAAELAKNEYESFQLILSPEKPLKNVKVAVGDFVMGKARLETRLHMVDYVNIVRNSELVVRKAGGVFGEAATMFENIVNQGPGEYPDPLASAKIIKSAGTDGSYAFWVTVKSSGSTPAGVYTAQAVITADGNCKVTVPLKVRVRNFALPEKFSSRNTAIMDYHHGAYDREKFHKLASEHHVTLCVLTKDPEVSFDASGKMKVDAREFDKEAEMAVNKYGANIIYFPGWRFYQLPRDFDMRATWYGVPICRTPGKLTPEFKEKFGRYLEYMSAHLKKKGWFEYARISMVDEPRTAADFALCQEFAALVRRHAPGVKTLVTKWPMKPLIGAPDIWCLGLIIPEDIKAAVARGESCEWYPNWHFVIDRPLMDSRMLGFMMYKFNIRGILYYNICSGWHDPTLARNPHVIYPSGRIINGLGLIIYRAEEKNGPPLSSIRLVMCRDAYEDYEYFLLADKLIKGCKDPAKAAAARKLLKEACDAIVPAYEAYADRFRWKKTKWETDGAKLLVWRRKIADLIEGLRR